VRAASLACSSSVTASVPISVLSLARLDRRRPSSTARKVTCDRIGGPRGWKNGGAVLISAALGWTRSAYSPYPGYRPMAGALGEYNGNSW
jgi:hypothetical protein